MNLAQVNLAQVNLVNHFYFAKGQIIERVNGANLETFVPAEHVIGYESPPLDTSQAGDQLRLLINGSGEILEDSRQNSKQNTWKKHANIQNCPSERKSQDCSICFSQVMDHMIFRKSLELKKICFFNSKH